MNSYDIQAVFQWWSVLFIIGIGFLPLTVRLFTTFFDRGYIFSKIFGLTVTTYIIFLLGAMRLVPFSTVNVYFILITSILFLFFFIPQKRLFFTLLKQSWFIFFFEELLFLGGLFFWAYIHAFTPDIHGLEKFMDYGFLNSILRSEYFPPVDMWFPPFPINYYYFGHIMTAVVTKLSGLPSNISFDLMLSTIFALCLSQTFSIGSVLYSSLKLEHRFSRIKQLLAGVLTAALVTFSGNLHILYAFFTPYKNDYPVPLWQLTFSPLTFPNQYWYPNATRFIYHTIHEFPIYSWVVADLHGHVLDIPLVLFIIAFLLNCFLHPYEPKITKQTSYLSRFLTTLLLQPYCLAIIGLFLAVMYMTNAWDGAIYLGLTTFVLFFIAWEKILKHKQHTNAFLLSLKRIIPSFLFVTASFAIFSAPYNIFFKPFVSGIGVLCAPPLLTNIGKIGPFLFEANHCQHSPWWQLLTLYGFFYFFVVIFLFFIARAKKILATDVFVLILIMLSTLLIIVPEFIYVKDIYPEHYRANTMFKLVFQAFIMLSISSAYIIGRLAKPAFTTKGLLRRPMTILVALITLGMLCCVLTYPYLAINSYYGNLKDYKGLDGTAYIQTLYPDDYAAIQWINKTITGQPIMLEAQGDSYTDYELISANTGLPTVLGWTVHEWLWRGTYDIPAARINDVKTLYETPDVQLAYYLLKKYNVQYVFVGTLEYQKYPQLNEAKFEKLGTVVFKHNSTKIIKITK